MLLQAVGTARFCYNWALTTWNQQYQDFKDKKCDEKPSAYSLCNLWTKERPEWAQQVGRVVQQSAILNVGVAFTNFWKHGKGFPQLKKKGKCRDSFHVDNAHAKIHGQRIALPKAGRVKMAELPRFDGKIMGYAVSHYAGQWHVSVRFELVEGSVNKEGKVGVDVGMINPAVASDGTVLVLPEKLHKLSKRLKRQQRALSRKKFASKNYDKQKLKKSKVQLKINNIRSDATHKFSSTVTKNHGNVVVEDLNLAGMHKTPIRNIRAGMQRSCMFEVGRQLSYKAQTIVKAPWNYPSSQLCSGCGSRQKLALSERTYHCPVCNLVIDRDMNAAVNLMNYIGEVIPDTKPVENEVPSGGIPPEVVVR